VASSGNSEVSHLHLRFRHHGAPCGMLLLVDTSSSTSKPDNAPLTFRSNTHHKVSMAASVDMAEITDSSTLSHPTEATAVGTSMARAMNRVSLNSSSSIITARCRSMFVSPILRYVDMVQGTCWWSWPRRWCPFDA